MTYQKLPFPITALQPVVLPKHAARRPAHATSVAYRSVGLHPASEKAALLLMDVYDLKFAAVVRIALIQLAEAAQREADARNLNVIFVADTLVGPDPRFQQPREEDFQ